MLRQKYKAPLSIKSPELRAKGNVDIRGENYSKGLNKQEVNLTDRLLASTWGVTLQKAREVYRAVVTLILTFAAPI